MALTAVPVRSETISVPDRLAGWPSRLLVPRESLPQTDDAFLRRLAHDTWRGLIALTDRGTRLPVDHVLFRNGSVSRTDAEVGHYTTTSSVGLFLIAIVAARDLGFTSTEEAEGIARAVLESVTKLETHHGFCFNFYDTATLARTSSFVSFVDSAWLIAGLMITRAAFPVLHESASRHIDQLDLGFFYHPAEKVMWHGYHVDRAQRSTYHYGAFFTEARLGSFIAIGKNEAPREHWRAMTRHLPKCLAGGDTRENPSVDGAEPIIRACGHYDGAYYVPSWGGSMFEALMPGLVVDEKLSPALWRNVATHARVQRDFALNDLKYRVWGMSPSAVPDADRYRYGEYGVGALGSAGYPSGVVTPHAAALALAVMPEAAVGNLRKLVELYDVYGEYGFYDAVDPRSGAVATAYLALDQSMILLALANHLTGGGIRERFMSDPIARAALPVLTDGEHIDRLSQD